MASSPPSTETLQRIDRLAGVPLCAALSLTRKIMAEPPPAEPVRSILFIKLAEQGSTVLAFPAIRRAVEMVGAANVYFVVFDENRFILDLLEIVPHENVITVSHTDLQDLFKSGLAMLRRLRAMKFDAVIDLEFFSRSSAALAFLCGARYRVGFHTFFGEGPYRGDLMTHRLLYNPYLHTVQIFALMVESLNADPRELPTFGAVPPPARLDLPRFKAGTEELETVRERVRALAGAPGMPRLALLNPNASDLIPLRKWPEERYVALARHLIDAREDVYVGMTGAPSEAEPIEKLARSVGSPRCFSLAGKTTLRELLVLYGLSELLITNDSGPAHFASLTPVDVITLFGPETPRLFGAPNERNTAVWKGIACSPCVNAYNNRQSPCRNNICMQQITVEEVGALALQKLDRRAAQAVPVS